jgi:tripartite-type tricarboxylate transporter receptor subunit TctC
MPLSRRILCAFAALALFASSVVAQTGYPTKPIRIVLAYTGGGPTDFLARLVSDSVSRRLGQPVLIEPKPGANERVATAHLIASPPDGYTAVLVAPPHATNPSLFQLPYDTAKETTGLIHLVNIAPLLTTYPDSGLDNFGDLVKLAKARPGEISFGSAGNATSTHLTVELLALLAGIQLQHIPYKGDAPAITDLLGKRIYASSNTITAGLAHVKAGRLKALGISSRERSPLLPEVPTFIEQGYPEADITTWFGLIVHAATPKDIVNRLNAEFNYSLQLPEVRERLAQAGMTAVGGTPEQFTAHIRRETERWAKVIQTRGIKVE